MTPATASSALARTRGPGEQVCQPVAHHPIVVLAVLQHRAERSRGDLRVELFCTQCEQGVGPVERLGDARWFEQVGSSQPLHGAGDLLDQPLRRIRKAATYDGDLTLEGRVVDPVVEAATLECVVYVAGAVGRDHDDGR